MEKYIFVLHNGHIGTEITRDCALRMQAAAELARKNPEIIVCFVGGGGLKPKSGAQNMFDFWRKEYSQLNNPLFILEHSNNTAANIKEIADLLLKMQQHDEVVIISNFYHVRRIVHFVRRNNLNIEVLDAEQILRVKRYRNSIEYFIKQLTEWILVAYVIIDEEQRIVGLWRKYFRDKN